MDEKKFPITKHFPADNMYTEVSIFQAENEARGRDTY
jgi:hypothetical protein